MKNLNREDQIKALAENYSDYRAVQKEIWDLGGIIKAGEDLAKDLAYEATNLNWRQKVTGIELVALKDLVHNEKALQNRVRLIQEAKEDSAA
jgi:hypothetical protein